MTLTLTLRLSRAATLQELGLPGSVTFSRSQIHLSLEELGGVCRRTGLRLALAGTLERGSPAALSALVRIAAHTVLSDDSTSVPLVDGTAN
ncbi:hypothetical protein AB0H18_27165 [Streptomyces sp. NPDC020766]|uniref:hypothetical protein n=1 Tax=Streptomyces sp. NPDC020766 TaxID=3155011 RepID=UPI0033D4A4CD